MYVERLERVAHPIPKPDGVRIPEGGIVAESRLFQQLPGIRNSELEKMISISIYRPVQDSLQVSFFSLQLFGVAIGFTPSMQADIPPLIQKHAHLLLQILDRVRVIPVPLFKGQEIETGTCAIGCLKINDLVEVPLRALLRAQLGSNITGLSEITTLQCT